MKMHLSFALHLGSVAALVALSACASQPQKPTLISSADGLGYALRYPATATEAAADFAEHKRRAHELSGALQPHTPVLKPGDDGALAVYVLDQADADGRRESLARARQQDRAFRALWEAERGAIAARTAAAVKKQQNDAGCTEVDSQAAIQRSLREGFDRQLEKRLRAESESQRMLEQTRSRFTPSTWTALQRLSAEVSLASYLVYVAMIEDTSRLAHLAEERDTVESTLTSARDRERTQLAALDKNAQTASRERLRQIDASLAALPASAQRVDRELEDYTERLRLAYDEYQRALNASRAALQTVRR